MVEYRGVACFGILCSLTLASLMPAAAQKITVTSADPPSAEQGTFGLDVRITGTGFEPGAHSRFLRTHTKDTGGVRVNDTTFISPTELIANVDVPQDAVIDVYDIEVMLLSGRTGKGIEKFSVVAKGANVCTLESLPAVFSQGPVLNTLDATGTPRFTGFFGTSLGIRTMTLGGRNVLVAVVGSFYSMKLEVFFLDPASGEVLDGQRIGSVTEPQPHLTLPIPSPDPDQLFVARQLNAGDINDDGAPDMAVGDMMLNAAYVFLSSLNGGVLEYQPAIRLFPPGDSNRFAAGVAIGNLDGLGGEEVAVGDAGGGPVAPPGGSRTGGRAINGRVHLYNFNPSTGTFSVFRTIDDPMPNKERDSFFGSSVAIGDVAGDWRADLVVGAYNSGAGRAYVFPGISCLTGSGVWCSSSPVVFSGANSQDQFGYQVAIADLNGVANELISSTSWGSPDIRAEAFLGPVGGSQPPLTILRPLPGLGSGWASTRPATGDINGDLLADVVVGAQAVAQQPVCGNVGGAYVYLTNPTSPGQLTPYFLQPPTLDEEGGNFGRSVAVAPGYPVFLVGEHVRNLGGVNDAGQVYVYKVVNPNP